MSRGRDSNIAYVALDQPDDSHSTPEPEDVSARTVLYGVLQHSGASLSAHQTMEAEYDLHAGIDRLAAELETIASAAQRDRFVALLGRSGLTEAQHAAAIESTAFGPLTAELRRAEAYHHDLERLVPRLVGQHGLDDADDIAAVLRYRLEKVAASPPRGCRLRPRLIAGLIPEPLGPMSRRGPSGDRSSEPNSSRRGPSRWPPQPSMPVHPGLAGWGPRRLSRRPTNPGYSRQRQSPRTATATRSSLTCRPVEEPPATRSGSTGSERSGPLGRQSGWRPRPVIAATSPHPCMPSPSHSAVQGPVSTARSSGAAARDDRRYDSP